MICGVLITCEYIAELRICGFVPGHMYDIMVEDIHNGGYNVQATYDYNDNCSVDLSMDISNESTYKRYFKPVEG